MLGRADLVSPLLDADPASLHRLDEHGRGPLDAATLLDTFRVPAVLHEAHDRTAALLVERGAALGLSHAGSLGRFDEVRRQVEADPDALHRPVHLVARIGGTATMESPLAAARRRGHAQILAWLLERGAVEAPEVVIR